VTGNSISSHPPTRKEEIAHTIRLQEEIGLDVLVHGKFERRDMVEYFGEQLTGPVTMLEWSFVRDDQASSNMSANCLGDPRRSARPGMRRDSDHLGRSFSKASVFSGSIQIAIHIAHPPLQTLLKFRTFIYSSDTLQRRP
jgi:hypothetical protein